MKVHRTFIHDRPHGFAVRAAARKRKRDQPVLESSDSGTALPKPARKRYGFGAFAEIDIYRAVNRDFSAQEMAEKAPRSVPLNCGGLPLLL